MNKANEGDKHDVTVYIVCDDSLMKIQELWCYKNLAVGCDIINSDVQFNKSKLLNHGLAVMRKDFDYVSIVDIDLIYNKRFFDTIVERVGGDIYFVSSGYKIDASSSVVVLNDTKNVVEWKDLSTSIDPDEQGLNEQKKYPSQVTMTKDLYERMIAVLGTLYCEDFKGWGGEDSALSMLSYAAERVGVFRKIYDHTMWYHLHHPRMPDYNQEQYNKNVVVLRDYLAKYKLRVIEMVKCGTTERN